MQDAVADQKRWNTRAKKSRTKAKKSKKRKKARKAELKYDQASKVAKGMNAKVSKVGGNAILQYVQEKVNKQSEGHMTIVDEPVLLESHKRTNIGLIITSGNIVKYYLDISDKSGRQVSKEEYERAEKEAGD